jgi:hypothetical protein
VGHRLEREGGVGLDRRAHDGHRRPHVAQQRAEGRRHGDAGDLPQLRGRQRHRVADAGQPDAVRVAVRAGGGQAREVREVRAAVAVDAGEDDRRPGVGSAHGAVLSDR